MLFSGKENVFMCLVVFQKMFRKIFSDVWLCSWKYHRKHIFYLLLTFSYIFSVAKRIYNIIHFSKHKQNPEKKIIKSGHFARSRSVRSALRAIGAVLVMSADDIGELGFGRSLLSLLSFSLSLFLSLSLSLLHVTWKWFEGKMKV